MMLQRRSTQSRLLGAVAAVALLCAACGTSDGPEAQAGATPAATAGPGGAEGDGATDALGATVTQVVQVATGKELLVPAKLADLTLSETISVTPAGRGQTLARDAKSGAVYMSWARALPGETVAEGKDPTNQIVVARSEDNGKTFGTPVVISGDQKGATSSTANPAQIEVGPDGALYVVYSVVDTEAEFPDYGRYVGFLVRSSDGGKTFSAPVQIVTDKNEGVPDGGSTSYMNALFIASDGDLFYSFLDEREDIAAARKAKAEGKTAEEHSGHGEEGPKPAIHLRVTRSGDGGASWTPSTMVSNEVCGCCGTVMTENKKGEVFVTTRSDLKKELKGSYDSVRDPIIAKSTDDGATWSKPVKIHNDGFKISGCPDVAAGLVADSTGLLHAAWYTGAESHAGVYYATSADGVTFTKPVALLRGDWAPYADVRLVLDGQDRPWVAFEDRSGEIDQVKVVRIDPKTSAAAFSTSIPGRGPDLAVGDDWALLTFESNPASEDDKTLPAIKSLIARPSAV